MDVCFTDRFNFFIIVPPYLPQFFLLVLSSYLLNLSFYAMQSGFFSYTFRDRLFVVQLSLFLLFRMTF